MLFDFNPDTTAVRKLYRIRNEFVRNRLRFCQITMDLDDFTLQMRLLRRPEARIPLLSGAFGRAGQNACQSAFMLNRVKTCIIR